MAIQIQNNYHIFKEIFKKDTGLDPVKNVAEYIAYYHARVNDQFYQVYESVSRGLEFKLEMKLDAIIHLLKQQ